MSEIANSDGPSESEKPVQNDVEFPPFPEPTDVDFDEDISENERNYYKDQFKELSTVKKYRLHCTACDRHLGCSARNERIRSHPMLRTLVCHGCHTFYNSGEFEKGDDGSELYCRWCGQGGQVYCCSDCPHVFCAKCIRRNLGNAKIKEIENADDWKCFKCKPESLKNLRAVCWAVLRYCDLKNKITYQTEDAELKAAYQKDCALDLSECCKYKNSKRTSRSSDALIKKKEIKKETDAKVAAVISKMPSTIQVKKFAAVPIDDSLKIEKKAQKRTISPKPKSFLVKNPISIVSGTRPINPACITPLAKKIRLPNSINTPVKIPNILERKALTTYTRIRAKPPNQFPIPISNSFNGFSSNIYHTNPNDNINLSLESLTQGLDMAAVAALNNSQDDDVVCTPDFPLEPLCEVTEDNDDDVECITPGPVAAPKFINPPPLVARTISNATTSNAQEVSSENIIQMTENDVTVNESTGGLKFRVDPQTLSSNKMYRLPDGRIFAINANANMPGGYSATIVAVTEANKSVSKGATFAAKLSSVSNSTSTPNKNNRNQVTRFVSSKRDSGAPKKTKSIKIVTGAATRQCDLNVPVEWYRYNLIDAVDALEYSLSRLQKLKKEATSMYLRTRSVNEMRTLQKNLERLLNTSSCRFIEIRNNLTKDMKEYVSKKESGHTTEEDDDIEILPDLDDDPIFIDENSNDSNMNLTENQEVDLTGPGSSECNESGETGNNKGDLSENENEEQDNDTRVKVKLISIESVDDKSCDDETKINGIHDAAKSNETDPLVNDNLKCNESFNETSDVGVSLEKENISCKNNKDSNNDKSNNEGVDEKIRDSDNKIDDLDVNSLNDKDLLNPKTEVNNTQNSSDKEQNKDDNILVNKDKVTQDSEDKVTNNCNVTMKEDIDEKMQDDIDDKLQDTEMSEELIDSLLKDDSLQDNTNSDILEAMQVN